MKKVMNMTNNVALVNLPEIGYKLLKDHNSVIFLDISGSTNDNYNNDMSVLDIEKKIVLELTKIFNIKPLLVSWHNEANLINDLSLLSPQYGTYPSNIFTNDKIVTKIKETEIAILITDGCIDVNEMERFSSYINKYGLHFNSVIGIVINGFDEDPIDTDISVLFPAMINNSCILVYNDYNMHHLLWGNDIFQREVKIMEIKKGIKWEDIPQINLESLCNMKIPQYDNCLVTNLLKQNYVPLGFGAYFNASKFISSDISLVDWMNYPFEKICQYYKRINKYDEIYNWFINQKSKILYKYFTVINENEIMDNLTNKILNRYNLRDEISDLLIKEYIRIRNIILTREKFDEIDNYDFLEDNKLITICVFISNLNKAMKNDMEMVIKCSQYTVSLFNSHISNKSDELIDDKKINYTKLNCSLCLDRDIPNFLIRKIIDCNNIDDINKNYLDYYYPYALCDKCSNYFLINRMDPNKCVCKGRIPFYITNDLSKYLDTHLSNLTNYDNLYDKPGGDLCVISNKEDIYNKTSNINSNFFSKYVTFLYKWITGSKNIESNNFSKSESLSNSELYNFERYMDKSVILMNIIKVLIKNIMKQNNHYTEVYQSLLVFIQNMDLE